MRRAVPGPNTKEFEEREMPGLKEALQKSKFRKWALRAYKVPKQLYCGSPYNCCATRTGPHT